MSAAATIIVDFGSSSVKAGTASESLPSLIFPSVVGVPAKKTGLIRRNKLAQDASPLAPFVVGAEALHEMHRATLHHPIQHGIVKDWPRMEQIIHHTFTEFGLNAEETSLVCTESLFTPKSCSEQLAELLFGAFDVASLAFIPSGICSLYASGRTTGIVLDSGDGVTQVTPVYDSYIIRNAANRFNHGGQDVTEHLRTLLFERGLNFTSPQDRLTVKGIKERLCYVSPVYEKELHEEEKQHLFALPDGQEVHIGREAFRAPEILFSPHITMLELPSMQDFVVDAVKGCSIDIRKNMLSSIILSGGNTMFMGFASRLAEEVLKEFPGLFGTAKVIDAPDRLYSVWSGASVLAGLASFSEQLVTRDVFDENGPGIIHSYGHSTMTGDEEELSAEEGR
ncbi:putative actin [Trypanosoma grayi]|uniref:putative actin n=1 Tax=Trypanosoma grayi TaxID=71804 RepID=UPI0004F4B398|nr:putative actin [Trypanosoma grayi]KEG11480.1 putative actin [Trypanosoma grayi]